MTAEIDSGSGAALPVDQDPATLADVGHSLSEDGVSVARATGVIALGNVVSRILGLGREMLLSDLFGAGAAVDAYNLAVIVPKTLYDLLIGGHVNSALVPVLSEFSMRKDRTALWQLVNLLLGVVVSILSILILVLEVLAPHIIRLLSGDMPFGPQLLATDLLPSVVLESIARSAALFETQSIATPLLRLTTPALMFLSIFAVLSGLLYALRRFTLPAFAGAMFKGSIVVVAIAAAPVLGIGAMAVGWLVGAFVQMATQLLGLRETRLYPVLRGIWSEPGVRRVGLLYLPVMFSLVIDTLVIRLVSYRLAAQVGEASISYMNYATTLVQFPHGLVATAISVAILPTLSRQAVLLSSGGVETYKATLGRGLRLAIVLILPAAVGLFVIAAAVVGLLFEHGSFTAVDTAYTSLALRLYLLGLPFAAIDLLLVFAFYSQQDTFTPAVIGVISLIAYMAVALGLMPRFGLFSLMIADSIKHMIHAVVAAWLLSRRIGGLNQQRLGPTVVKSGLATFAMGLVAYYSLSLLAGIVPSGSVGEALLVLGAAGIGAVVFALLAAVLQIEDLNWLFAMLRRKFRH